MATPVPVNRLLELARELKRRGVVRVALVNLAVAFVILQAAGLPVPHLLCPEVVSRAILALLIPGLPIALVVGWAYDLTSESVRRAGDGPDPADDQEKPPPEEYAGCPPGGSRRGAGFGAMALRIHAVPCYHRSRSESLPRMHETR